MASPLEPGVLVVFPSRLGWMAMVGCGRALRQLTFGHRSATQAMAALSWPASREAEKGPWNPQLLARLQAYAAGAYDDFLDVEVDPGPQSDFRRRVMACCRRVPFGTTLTYGQLAAQAGVPGAARAVGRCMATNPVPIIIPCHRVVAADGSLHGYSSPGGVRMKQRLLQWEAKRRRTNWPRIQQPDD